MNGSEGEQNPSPASHRQVAMVTAERAASAMRLRTEGCSLVATETGQSKRSCRGGVKNLNAALDFRGWISLSALCATFRRLRGLQPGRLRGLQPGRLRGLQPGFSASARGVCEHLQPAGTGTSGGSCWGFWRRRTEWSRRCWPERWGGVPVSPGGSPAEERSEVTQVIQGY